MLSAAVVTTLLEHPDSPAREAITQPAARRTLIGVGMGLTAIGLIYSPGGGVPGRT